MNHLHDGHNIQRSTGNAMVKFHCIAGTQDEAIYM